ncbi:hypothetical protein ENUP19_0063G0033 [Entamoeba nuttalli]
MQSNQPITLELLDETLKKMYSEGNIIINEKSIKWIEQMSMIETTDDGKYLGIFEDFLRHVDSKEFNEKLTLFNEGKGTKIVDKILKVCVEPNIPIENVSKIITCLAFITNNNFKTKEYLYEHNIIEGIENLLIQPEIVKIIEELFSTFEYERKVTTQLTSVQFVTSLLSGLLTLVTNCEDIQKEISEKGIIELLLQLLSNGKQAPNELMTIYGSIIAIIDSYIEKSIKLLPQNTINILKELIFEAQAKGIRIMAIKALTDISDLKLEDYRSIFDELITPIEKEIERTNDEFIKQSLLLLFRSICNDEKIESYRFIPFLNSLIEMIQSTIKETMICAIEAINSIALRDDTLNILSNKVEDIVKRIQGIEGEGYSSLMLLLTNMGRTDETIRKYKTYKVTEQIIEYIKIHPHDERALLMSLSVINSISVLHENRDYLTFDLNIFEVLNDWYNVSTNQVIIFNIQQIISRLILNSSIRAEHFMNLPTALNAIIETAGYTVRLIKEKRTPQTSTREVRDVRVAYEATRILCNLINFKSEYANTIMKDPYVIYAILDLIHSHYQILKDEGNYALNRLKQYEIITDDDIKKAEASRI